MFGKAKAYGWFLWQEYMKFEKYTRLQRQLDEALRKVKDLGQEMDNKDTVSSRTPDPHQPQPQSQPFTLHGLPDGAS